MKNISNLIIIGKFSCCNKVMIVVRINKSVCVMAKEEYNKIVRREWKEMCTKNKKNTEKFKKLA